MMRRIISMIFVGLCFGISINAKNIALLVGIGNYDSISSGWNVIHGNNDVALLSKKLESKGFSISTLTDKKATKANVLQSLAKLESSVAKGDLVYIHFSGHGQQIKDMNNDEQGEFDQSFVCYDACFSSNYKIGGMSYRGENHLIDDELFPYLNRIKSKVGTKGSVIVIFDSCYSGGADRSGMPADPESEVAWIDSVRGTDYEFHINKNSEMYLRSIKKPGDYTREGGTVTVISACESDKKNYECKEKHSGRKYGSLSYTIGKLLDNGIPFEQWGTYFSSGKYKSLKIFRPSQHPVVESHK